jgi:1-deoxy-D-xylulose-5-phosphate synthase
VGLADQRIARDIVAQVLGTRIPVARPLPDEATADESASRIAE